MPRERKAIYFELVVVVGILVVPSLLKAVFQFLHPDQAPRPEFASWYFGGKLAAEILLLGLLWHVIRLNGESAADFTKPFSGMDLARGLGLATGAYLSFYAAYMVLWKLGIAPAGAADDHATEIFQAPLSPLYVLAILINPFVEETFVRGFLQTRLRQAQESPGVILLASTVLQTSYHIYQGVGPCLSLAPGFALFAAYYHRTGRLWPVIVAHLLEDVVAMLVLSR